MRRVLIGHSSELFARSVAHKLGSAFETQICLDGSQIGPLLDSFQPDVLLLHGAMPRKDTLSILCQCPVLPRLTIITVNYLSSDQEWKLRALGVRQILLMPSPGEVVMNVHSWLDRQEQACDADAYRVRLHLLALNFDTQLEGFRLISSAVPLFMEDLGQTLSKHIYPAVAQLHGLSDQRAVEHSIRNSIEKAWHHRNETVWARFFPQNARGEIPCPSNRKMLTILAQWLAMKQ